MARSVAKFSIWILRKAVFYTAVMIEYRWICLVFFIRYGLCNTNYNFFFCWGGRHYGPPSRLLGVHGRIAPPPWIRACPDHLFLPSLTIHPFLIFFPGYVRNYDFAHGEIAVQGGMDRGDGYREVQRPTIQKLRHAGDLSEKFRGQRPKGYSA